MKTKKLFIVLGISSLTLISSSLYAQIGTSEDNIASIENRNKQRINDMNLQVKDAKATVKQEKRDLKKAKKIAKEAKAALRAEKQAQKARKEANNQAIKAGKALN